MIKYLDYRLDHRRSLVTIVAAAALLCGCAIKPILRPYPEPSASAILEALRQDAALLRTLRSSARVEHDGPGLQRIKITVGLFVARGGRLRVDAEGPLGGAIAQLVADGQRFSMLDVRENRFLSGPAEACNVARLLQVALSPTEIADVLLGGAPLEGQAGALTWDSKRGHELLELYRNDSSRIRLHLRARPGPGGRRYDLVGAEQMHADGGILFRIEHSGFEDRAGGIRLPQRTTINDLVRKKTLYVRYTEVEPNVEPNANVFVLSPPDGITNEEVSCGAR